MCSLQALLWDVDGTLAETERDGHRPAFNRAFEEAGLCWHWDEATYGELLAVTGGRERILHDLSLRPRRGAPSPGPEREALARRLHQRKNHWYAQAVDSGALALRPGVAELIAQAHEAGCRQAIVTTTSRANVDALLGACLGVTWRERIAVVVCGEDVQHKKPDPEAYRLALQRLGLAPQACLAIEDSPVGVRAARAAHVPVIVTRSQYFASADPVGALAVGPGLGSREGWMPPVADAPDDAASQAPRVVWSDLLAWHARVSEPAAPIRG